jgi:hypothetical protein
VTHEEKAMPTEHRAQRLYLVQTDTDFDARQQLLDFLGGAEIEPSVPGTSEAAEEVSQWRAG